ncbi:MAG: type II toxin-antitoxin system PemK/MazF family toxin [Gaiellaceae bacterium]
MISLATPIFIAAGGPYLARGGSPSPELEIVLPVTSVDKRIAFHVGVEPPEGGLRSRSFIKPEDIRSISAGRLRERLGRVSAQTLEAVEARLRVLLDL